MGLLVRWTAATVVAFLAAAEPAAASPLELTADDLDAVVLLEGWRYRPGDDPSWSAPELDDTTWERLGSAWLEQPPASGWTGIGWFRLRLRRSADLEGRVLGFHLRQRGASEVYLDGDLLRRYGKVAAHREDETAHWPRQTILLPIHDTDEHVLAVRYSNASQTRQPGANGLGFAAWITDLEDSLEHGQAQLAGPAGRWKMWMGAALAFAVLHVCLFLFRPAERDNLYFALATAGFAGLTGFTSLAEYESHPLHSALLVRAAFASGIVMLLGFTCFGVNYFQNRWSWMLRLRLVAGVFALVWTLVFATPTAFYVYAFVAVSSMIPGLATIKIEDAGGAMLASGFVVVGLTGVAQILTNLGAFGPEGREIYPYGMFYLFLSISISLARDQALTHRELEQQLTQVRELSERALEQEKQSRRREIERRLLEADNARKTEELEDARQLQLSLLPEERPSVPGLEVSFTMRPATEVGGDYYDYVDADGTLTLAIGDATGHGLQAGMLAMSAKGLFQTTNGGEDVGDALRRIARGIDGMRLGRMNMALALMRYDAGRWRLASAGMPPFLCYRAASAVVEEVELPSPPLGTMRGHEYGVAEVVLGPGDLLLAMTDGLPETLDPDDEMLGYEALKPLLAELAERPLGKLLEGFLDAARRWARGRVQEDDLTLVVVRATARETIDTTSC